MSVHRLLQLYPGLIKQAQLPACAGNYSWEEEVRIKEATTLKKKFDRDGYVAIPKFLTADEVAELEAHIARYVKDVVPNVPAGEVFYEIKGQPETLKQLQRMFRYDDWFQMLFFAERFTKLAKLLLDAIPVGKNLQWFNKPPLASSPTPPHQDGYYFMIEPCDAVTMWLALDVVDEENGCVRYVRGSHRKGLRLHGSTGVLGFSQGITDYCDEDQALEVPMPAAPGDLLIHHSLTIHSAGSNRSQRARKALGFIYYSSKARENTEAHEEYQRKIKEEWGKENRL
jgi:phytanoyl-CoA hydroxylase